MRLDETDEIRNTVRETIAVSLIRAFDAELATLSEAEHRMRRRREIITRARTEIRTGKSPSVVQAELAAAHLNLSDVTESLGQLIDWGNP